MGRNVNMMWSIGYCEHFNNRLFGLYNTCMLYIIYTRFFDLFYSNSLNESEWNMFNNEATFYAIVSEIDRDDYLQHRAGW